MGLFLLWPTATEFEPFEPWLESRIRKSHVTAFEYLVVELI